MVVPLPDARRHARQVNTIQLTQNQLVQSSVHRHTAESGVVVAFAQRCVQCTCPVGSVDWLKHVKWQRHHRAVNRTLTASLLMAAPPALLAQQQSVMHLSSALLA